MRARVSPPAAAGVPFAMPGSSPARWLAALVALALMGTLMAAPASVTAVESYVVASDADFGDGTLRDSIPDADVNLNIGQPNVILSSTVLHVTPTARGAADCLTWANSCGLQAALSMAVAGDEIWVAQGEYRPAGDRTGTFALKDGVALYGGFAGGESDGETARNQRNWAGRPTVLTGGPIFGGDNNYHVVTAASGVGNSAVLDGFSIINGYANGPVNPGGFGAGILSAGSPTLRNLDIRNNMAHVCGGGVSITGSPTLTNVLLRNNTADLGAAGICVEGGAPVITNATLYENNVIANSIGAAILVQSGTATVTNTIAWLNRQNTNTVATYPIVNAIVTYTNAPGVTGTGNINSNPLFISTAPMNLRLSAGSPAINAGSTTAVPAGVTVDLDGNPRLVGSAVDMGAYEYQGGAVAPVITVSGGSLAYPENGEATAIDAFATVSDPDSADLDTGTLTVDYAANGSADDRLAIANQGTGAGQIGVSGDTINYGGTAIGTFGGGTGTNPLVATLNANATPAAAQALVRAITFANVSDSPSELNRTVRFVLSDGDGSTGLPATRIVTVSAVNDPPLNTVPSAQTVAVGMSLVFSSGNDNAIAVADVDAGGDPVEVSLYVDRGTLSLAGTAGLTFITGDGTADASMAFSGTLADANAALNGMGYAAAGGDLGTTTLSVSTNDQGATGSGGAQSDSDTVAITVTLAHTYVVNSTNEPGNGTCDTTECTLREAINAANAAAGMDGIDFDIPTTAGGYNATTGVWSITPSTGGLPFITGPVVIDGYSQPGAIEATESAPATLKIMLSGTSAGSDTSGLFLSTGSDGSTIKGLAIGSFSTAGIALYGDGSTVSGNHLGTDATGTLDLGNNWYGVNVVGSGNTIGGTTPAARNVISGNSQYGVSLSSAGGDVVQGNYIGTNAAGSAAISNSIGVLVSSSDNLIGGTAAGTANLISGNGLGVLIQTGPGNDILGNRIHGNGGMGIDLAPTGVAVNDAGDDDGGPNNNQNYPVLDAAISDGTATTVSATLDSNPGTFRIEFFSNPVCDGSGNGEGQVFLGYQEVVVDSTGVATFSTTLGAPVPASQVVTATATGSDGTSEFSACQAATGYNVAPIGLTLSNAAVTDGRPVGTPVATLSTSDPNAGDTHTYSLTPGTGDIDNASFAIVGDELRVAAVLDYATKSSYSIRVRTTDGGGLFYEDVFTISVKPPVVISQVYGGGGQAGAWFRNDYIELYNRGAVTISIDGWTVQYASATGTGNFANNTTSLSGSLAPGQYYLVQGASSGPNGAALPTPDVSGTIQMAGDAGKVVVASTATGIACNGSSTPCSATQLAQIVDLVGYGTGASGANFYEGTGPGPTLNAIQAAARLGGGSVDTDDNAADFLRISPPNPHNSVGNSPPVISLPGSPVTYTENGAPVVIDAGATVTDTDTDYLTTGTLTVDYAANGSADDRLTIQHQGFGAGQIGVSGGNVTYGGVVIGTFAGGSGTAALIVTLNNHATPAIVQALARAIQFNNVSERPSTLDRTVRFVVTDGEGGTSAAATKAIGVAAVNDAPALNATLNPTLTSISNDMTTNPGDLVASLVALSGYISDADADAVKGLAVTVVDNTNGSWEYSLNGTTWTAFGAPSTTTARLLAGDADNRIRFVPASGWIGTAALTFRAWDQTSGADGATADAAANGGSTAFSSASDSALITVTAPAAQTYVVNSTADPGTGGCDTAECTLREAISAANAHANVGGELDRLEFAIPTSDAGYDSTSGVWTIVPTSVLPPITDPIALDGYTQPGAAVATASSTATLKIVLDGRSLSAMPAIQLLPGSSGSTVSGLAIGSFTGGTAVYVDSSNNVIAGNYLGISASGTTAMPNRFGVQVMSDTTNNTIGGNTPAARNVISGNTSDGVSLRATSHSVLGNYIGTNASGTGAVGNADFGVSVLGGAHTIGGTDAGSRNVISGNAQGVRVFFGSVTLLGNYIGPNAAGTGAIGNGEGVWLEGTSGSVIGGSAAGSRNVISGNRNAGVHLNGPYNVVQGNYIGTNAAGTGALPNNPGIHVGTGTNNVIGGTATGAGNVISGNTYHGLTLYGGAATVQGNYIGTNAAGTAALSNGMYGVYVTSGGHTIGGTVAGAGNVVAYNSDRGLLLLGGIGNRILGNSIHSNGSLGIDLIPVPGVTPNDSGDADSGANNLQNFPALTSATADGSSTAVSGALNSTSNTNGFRIEFFSSPTCDPSGNGEGGTYLGFVDVNTDSSGYADVGVTLAMAVTVGHVVTATATDSSGNTSEFSECVTVTAAAVNHAPTGISLSASSVAENQPSGTTVGTFSTTDPDPGDTFTYTLVAGTGDTDNGSFEIVGSQLQTKTVFDYETRPSYSIRVRTFDGGLGFEKVFTITVSNANDAPTDISVSPSSVAENLPADTTVGTFGTTDQDVADSFTYSLVEGDGDTDNASFAVDGSTLKTAGVFNRETKSSYTIRVRTTDTGSLWFEETFTISVTDVNEAPTDINLSPSSVAENSPSGTQVGIFSTTDPDASLDQSFVMAIGAVFTYELVSGAGDADNAMFTIDLDTLKTADVFDCEGKSSYSIRVRSTDGGTPALSTEKSFTITVTNVNEAPWISDIADQTVDEDGTRGPIGFGIGDPETAPGSLNLAGTSSNTTLVPDANIVFGGSGASRTVTVTPTANQSGSAVITITVGDGSLTAIDTFTLTVTALNDAPVNNVPGAQSVAAGSALVFSTANSNAITVTDDAGTNSIAVTLSAGHGLLTVGSFTDLTFNTGDGTADASMTFTGALPDINAALEGLSYSPSAGYVGTDALTVYVSDLGNTGSGGFKTDTDTVAINVVAPDLTLTKVHAGLFTQGQAGAEYTITVTNSGTGATNATVSVVDTLPTGMTISGLSGTGWTCLLASRQCSRSDPLAPGASYPTITLTVNVSSFAPVSLTNSAVVSTTGEVNIANNSASDPTTILPTEHPPSIAGTTSPLPYTENAPATAVDPGLTLTDAVSASLVGATVAITDNYGNGQDVLNFTDTLTITGNWNAATGTLTLTGTASLASYQAALRSISYANTSDAPTTATRTVTFTADDGSATSNTGSGTRAIEITAVNDAPVNTVPGAQSVPANTDLVFHASNDNAISVAHPDSATDSVAVDLAVGHGTLTLGAVAGLTFEAGDGMADAYMSFSGSLAAVNAALVGLSYSPALGYSGPDLVTLTSDDQGGTGIGGALSDTDTVSITVTPPTVLPDTTVTAGPTGWTRDSTPTFGFVSNVTGATFECRVDDADFVPCSSPHTTATLGDGPHTFTVRAVVAGFPDATPATRTLTVDLTAPYTGYVEVFLREGAQARHGPVKLTWQASDNLAPDAQLRHQIEVRGRRAGSWGSWHDRTAASATEFGWVQPLWHAYQYRVRTGDLAGNWSAWEESEPILLVRRQESSFTLLGGWTAVARDSAMGHRIARSSTANATATLRFWGNGIALVLPAGAGQGTVEVCLDPGTASAQCRTVNLATFQPTGSRRLVAAFTELSLGYHRVSVRVVGGTIDLDGALISR